MFGVFVVQSHVQGMGIVFNLCFPGFGAGWGKMTQLWAFTRLGPGSRGQYLKSLGGAVLRNIWDAIPTCRQNMRYGTVPLGS